MTSIPPKCNVYAAKDRSDKLLYVLEGLDFPSSHDPNGWRLIVLGAEPPRNWSKFANGFYLTTVTNAARDL